ADTKHAARLHGAAVNQMNAVQPRRKAFAVLVAAESTVRAQDGVLERLFRILLTAEQSSGEAREPRVVTVHDYRVRRNVASEYAADHFAVRGRHRPRCDVTTRKPPEGAHGSHVQAAQM